MTDIAVIRAEILDKYKELCSKINHPPNTSFVRTFGNSNVKSFYLDLVFRGNDKLHFGNRFTDRDIILLSSALENHEKVKSYLISFSGTLTSPSMKFRMWASRYSQSTSKSVQTSKVSIFKAIRLKLLVLSASVQP